jgi:site-specific recombinase XerD
MDKSVLQRAVEEAPRKAGLARPVTCHAVQHSFATHLAKDGSEIGSIEELLGHRNTSTTMIYT